MQRTLNGSSSRTSVAVLIAARNARRTIARAVSSALAEPEVARVVVVDDASTDTTSTVARAADDGSGRLTILALEQNAGPAAARNRALDVCRTEWISVLDADDFFLPGRTERLVERAREWDADFVADNLLQVNESAQEVLGAGTGLFTHERTQEERLELEGFVLANISRRGRLRKELGFLKPLMRRSFLLEHGLRYDERLRLGEDYDLYARALALGALFVLTPGRGYVSVMRRGSLSDRHGIGDLEQLYGSDLRLIEMPGLDARERRAIERHAESIQCKLEWRRFLAAVDAKSPAALLRPFTRSLPITGYLVGKLADEAFARTLRRIRTSEALIPVPTASGVRH
jgi:succinoglycan biosynthesis protein ExoU